MKPVVFTEQFIRSAVAKGSIVPPRDGVGPSNAVYLLQRLAWFAVPLVLVVLGFIYGVTVK